MKKILIIGFLLIVSLGLWAFWVEPSYFKISHYAIKVPRLKNTLTHYKVAVIADLHTGSPYNSVEKLKKIVHLTNLEKPDLILIVGDLVIHGVVGGEFVKPEEIATELGLLKASDGTYAVLGNHDLRYDPQAVRSALEKAGIPVLDETTKLISSGKTSFWLMGIGDFWEGAPNVDKNTKSVTDNRPIISFTHNPDIFPTIPSRVALTFAGHTHGGQVYIPLIGRPVVPSRYDQRFAIGHIIEEERHLFVSPGVGTSILPVRFLVPPEVSMVTINPRTR